MYTFILISIFLIMHQSLGIVLLKIKVLKISYLGFYCTVINSTNLFIIFCFLDWIDVVRRPVKVKRIPYEPASYPKKIGGGINNSCQNSYTKLYTFQMPRCPPIGSVESTIYPRSNSIP